MRTSIDDGFGCSKYFVNLCWIAEAGAGEGEGEGETTRKRPKCVVDVGCGIGGSSRYLAAKYGATCKGITLSPFQAQRANALADAQGLSHKVIRNSSTIYFLDIPPLMLV